MKKLLFAIGVMFGLACSAFCQDLSLAVIANYRVVKLGDTLRIDVIIKNNSSSDYFVSKKQFALYSPIRFYTKNGVSIEAKTNLIIDYAPIWCDEDVQIIKPNESFIFSEKYYFGKELIYVNGKKKTIRFLARDLFGYGLPVAYSEKIYIEDNNLMLKAVYSQYGNILKKKGFNCQQLSNQIESSIISLALK